ncbi:hypothetical protein MRY26_24415 [Escherichia coli]|uniref:hypothetical protein n=1 Tax=Escherichia coli TaxID=562 RepID=UPI001FAA7CAD|nr:hypothetical protein [Escherichia coli]MCI4860436.1 hypothetical protein [Escherichia coli]
MEIDIALQEKIRDDVLKAIEINKIEGLIDDRPALLIEMGRLGNDSNLLIVFYVQIMPDDFVMQLHRF